MNFCLVLGLFMLILYFVNYLLWGENVRIIYLLCIFRLGILIEIICVVRIFVYSWIFCFFGGILFYKEKLMIN